MPKKMIPVEELTKIHAQISAGASLSQLSAEFKKSKGTVYYHMRKIRGKTIYPVIVHAENSELVGEFIGVFCGDGCLDITADYKYRIYLFFNKTEDEYTSNLIENVLIKLFTKRPMIFRVKNIIILCYYSRNIHTFIKSYAAWNSRSRKTHTVCLKEKIHSNKFMIGFLRGCLDSDGYISPKRISFASVSIGLINDIMNFLDELQISYSLNTYKEKRKNRKDLHQIYISRSSHQQFMEVIQPRNKKGLMRRPGFEFPNA